MLIDDKAPQEVLNLQKQHLDILQRVPPGKPILIKCREGDTAEGQDPDLYKWVDFKTVWDKVFQNGVPIYTRGILRNEIVFDPDAADWADMKEELGKVIAYLTLQEIPYELAYSGGKGCHLQIFVAPFDVDTCDFKDAQKYDVDAWKCARETIVKELLLRSGADPDKMGLDLGKIKFTNAKDSNGRNRKGSQIREYGTTRANGKYKTLVDEIPETNPDYLPLRFPGQPQLWNISGTVFHDAVRDAFKAEVERAKTRNEFNLDDIDFSDTEISKFPCFEKIKALHLKTGRYYAASGMGLLCKMCGYSREETGEILTDVLNTFNGLSPADTEVRLNNSLDLYDTDKHFSCRKLKELVGPVCDFTRCPLKEKGLGKTAPPADPDDPAQQAVEKTRKAKEEMLAYMSMPESESQSACRAVWKKYGLNGHDFTRAYDEVFMKVMSERRQKEEQDKKEEPDPEIEAAAQHINERAMDIAENGNPLAFLIATHQELHVGDIGLATTLILSTTCQQVQNTDGIHPKLSGPSGAGKTDCAKAAVHIIPPEWVLISSLSNKSIFYMEERMKPGTVVFLDDVNLDEEMEKVINRATSFFQNGAEHTTLDVNREVIILKIPERLTWWLTSIDDDQSLQLLNRTFGGEVDESREQDKRVAKRQREQAKSGAVGLPVNENVLICREILRDIKKNIYIVKIPFADAIIWNDESNRRNQPMFLDIIKAFAVLRHRQRETDQDGALLATYQDYIDAKMLYTSRQEAQKTKLTASERKVCEVLSNRTQHLSLNGSLTAKELRKELGVSSSRLSQILHGKGKGDTGLLFKVKEIWEEDRSVKDDSGSFTKQKAYGYDGVYNPLDGYESIVDYDNAVYPVYPRFTPSLPFKNDSGSIVFTLFTHKTINTVGNIIKPKKLEEVEKTQ